ncbi:hypothetical protein PC116_g4054 [Phytophthora cactorum]|uniref:DDE Tnp4 domain-containing protein n=1 Tax=Phytophthora cactorum TaxID=29920 RepID=A0A329SXX6_9STRA|nr:hypothetical protein PC114_g2204 [Phytophthora cactorum]KAG2953353.1 hypothetical protein PC117_g2068 [Phytophthora cactorum]KAG3040437.1 hypothetical protein PC119_g1435 [Phytophthora cactorum]KAG3191004.1 hypothetical protein C6341_g1439 [Phytophthora cactorum]KAG4248210.1 hypothetical protein PC116_g4054 [Phytophthora cactorum]
MNVVTDSAFPYSSERTGRILTPLKDKGIDRILPSLRSSARTLRNTIISVRQAAEWGMGIMQKGYGRLDLPLPYDPELRGLRINNIVLLSCQDRPNLADSDYCRLVDGGAHG